MSTVDRFPSMIDHQFERERIFQKEIESKKKEVKIAKPDESKPLSGQALRSFQLNQINEKKFTFNFMKKGEYHSSQFEDHEVIYMTLISKAGGTIRMRAGFNSKKEQSDQPEGGAAKWWENAEQTPEQVVESLN